MDKRRTALVTGGSRGIGKAICMDLARKGFDVVFSFANSEEAAKEVEESCEALGAKALGVKADVSIKEECELLMSKAIEFGEGHLDVLVNNAGITKDGLLMRMSDTDFEDVLDVNLKGSFYMMRAASKIMLKQRAGSIINMSSVSGVLGNAGQVNYSASKAGVIGMTKSLARELAGKGIRVNAVAPGFIETDMTAKMPEAAIRDSLLKVPMGRVGRPEDVANMVSFLAKDESSYITGQVFCVDGGMAI